MQPTARIKRAFIWNFLIALTVDLFVAIAIAYLSGEKDTLPIVVVSYLAIQLFRLLLWVRASIISWISFGLYRRKIIGDLYLNVFKKEKFPEPVSDEIHEYLSSVLSNRDNKVETIISASKLYGEAAILRGENRFQDIFQIQMAFGDAVEEYSKSFQM